MTDAQRRELEILQDKLAVFDRRAENNRLPPAAQAEARRQARAIRVQIKALSR